MTTAKSDYGEFTVSLLIRGFECEPDIISELVGLEPTKSWKKGQRMPSGVVAGTSGWKLESECQSSVEIAAHIKWLLARLPPSFERLRQRAPEINVSLDIYLVLCNSHAGPSLVLDVETMRRLTSLGIHVDCDLYASARV